MSEQLSKIIEKKLKKIPRKPGVYYFKNKKREIIYIGKAKNLYKRINAHRLNFYRQKKGTKPYMHNNMLAGTDDITWNIVDTEADAFIRESQEISLIKPLYNILLRDDKRYFYVALTTDDFPKIKITHQPEKYSKDNTIGPFTNGRALKQILAKIREIVPFCSCKNTHKHPCVYAQLGLCPGYCCLRNDSDHQQSKDFRENYHDNLKKVFSILTGQRSGLITRLRNDLKRKILEENFEEAKQLSLEIKSLENIFDHKSVLKKNPSDGLLISSVSLLKEILSSKALPSRIEAFDVSNIRGKYATGSMIVFSKRIKNRQTYYYPNKKEYRIFHIKNKIINNDLDMLKEIMTRRLNHSLSRYKKTIHQKKENLWPLPQLVLIDGGKTHLAIALSCFDKIKKTNNAVKCLALAKRQEKLYTIFCDRKDAIQVYFLDGLNSDVANLFKRLRNEAHRFAIKHHRNLRKNHLKKTEGVLLKKEKKLF